MKILHTSDLHLDSSLTTRFDPSKIRERKSELLLSFKRLAERADTSGAEAFIIAGDLFDSEKIAKKNVRNVLQIIAEHSHITFFYLQGNHEKNVIADCGLPIPNNLLFFDREWTYYKLGEINIIGRYECTPTMFSELKLSETEINIVVLHGELRDRSDSGGVIGKNDIGDLPIDYLALGHYHSYSETRIGNRCSAVYPGTPEGRGFDEVGPCGFAMISIDKYGVSHNFEKSAMRELHIIETDVSDTDSDLAIVYKIEKQVKSIPRSDLIRIKLVGNIELGREIGEETLASALTGFYYSEIKNETRVRICADDFKNDISLKGEFIRGVLAASDLDEKEKEATIKLGLSLLLGGQL